MKKYRHLAKMAVQNSLISAKLGYKYPIKVIGIVDGLKEVVDVDITDCQFTSDDPTIAVVNKDYQIACLREGETFITMTCGHFTDVIHIEINGKVFGNFNVEDDSLDYVSAIYVGSVAPVSMDDNNGNVTIR